MNAIRCPRDETLLRYAAGDLDETAAADVDSHLGTCETCLTRMDEVSKSEHLFPKLHPNPTPAATPPALDRAVSAAIQKLSRLGCPANRTPQRVADYVLLEEVGRGGMGQVFRATHTRLGIDVAVKLLRTGFDTPALRARFEAERQTLARMDHPNIAKVFDAGVGDGDQPFIVMEYLHGTSLTKFAVSHAADLRTRLTMIRQVCNAIQHAHQKGIIHRDIKPSNVIVTQQDDGFVPKVIDFGVARVVDPLAPRQTEHGFVVGTLEYMSPEQTVDTHGGIDTRSDVYSLGVLLYELVTGDTPTAAIRKTAQTVLDTLTLIREVDPPRPSAAAGAAGPSGRVRDELDWITLKALEKEPARRYDTATAFGDDIARLLADEPVLAAPPSRVYRLRKFLRRNSTAVLGSAFVVLALCGGIVGTTWQMLRAMDAEEQSRNRATAAATAERQAQDERTKAAEAEEQAVKDRNRAVDAEADANAFNAFLVDAILSASRPNLARHGLGRSVTLAEALAVAETQIDRVFANRPAAEIKARVALSQTWYQLRRFPEAERHTLRAIDLLERQPVRDEETHLKCRAQLAQLWDHMSRLAEARSLGEELLPLFVARYGADHDETLTAKMELGMVYLHLGQLKPAMVHLGEAAEGRGKLFGPNHEKTLTAVHNVAEGLSEQRKHTQALAVHQDVLSRRRITLGNEHSSTISSMNNVGCQLYRTKQLNDSIKLFEEALPLARSHLGDEHTTTTSVMNNLGLAYRDAQKTDDAIRLLEETRTLRTRSLGAFHKETLTTLVNLASCYRTANRLADAIAAAQVAFAERLKLLGLDHAETRLAGNNLGSYLLSAERYDEAIAVLAPVAKRSTELDSPIDARTVSTSYYLAQAYTRHGRPELGEPWLFQSLPYAKTPAGRKTPMGRTVLELCGGILVDRKEYAEAEPILRLCVPDDPSAVPDTVTNAKAYSDLGVCCLANKQFAKAESLMLTSQTYLSRGQARGHKLISEDMMHTVHQRLGNLYKAWEQPEKATAWRNKPSRVVEVAPRPRAASGR